MICLPKLYFILFKDNCYSVIYYKFYNNKKVKNVYATFVPSGSLAVTFIFHINIYSTTCGNKDSIQTNSKR